MATINIPELVTIEIVFEIKDGHRTGANKYVGQWGDAQPASLPQTGDEIWLGDPYVEGQEHLYKVITRRWYHKESVTVFVEQIVEQIEEIEER